MNELPSPSDRDLKSLQFLYAHEERKALDDHFRAVQSIGCDVQTPFAVAYVDYAMELRRINRELAQRQFEQITAEWSNET